MTGQALSRFFENMMNFILVFIKDYLPKIIIAVIIMLFAAFLARQAAKLVERTLIRSKAEKGVTTLLMNLTRWTIMGIGLVVSAGLFFDVSALLTTLGLAAFAVTFAFQDVLKNLVAGIIILVQHPFNIGESVNIGGFEGIVVTIESRMTEIECFDGRAVAIPNGIAISQPIINYTRSPKRRADIPLHLTYEANIRTLRETIVAAVKKVPGYIDEPTPFVTLESANELSLGMTVYFWVDVNILGAMMIVRDYGLEAITAALAEKGISMPVPLQSVVVKT